LLINRKSKSGQQSTELTVRELNPLSSKRPKFKLGRWSLIGGNVALLLFVAIFILANRSASQTIRSSTINSAITSAGSLSSPLDQLSSSQIALEAARMTRLPESTAVRNQADSESAILATSPTDTTVLAKPQVVSTAQKSKHDIIRYVAKTDDNVTSVATKFGLSANSVRWSNSLTSDSLSAGKELLIPPADGIVYKVKSGDTIDSVSSKYQANKDSFIAVNDAESGSLAVDDLIWIPNGTQPLPNLRFSTASSGGFAWGYSAIYGNSGYDYGYCTWWAALRRSQIGRPVPSNLGNAISWKTLAARAGFGVDQAPQVGAVVWTPASYGYGHVGFVEKINDDGSVWVSDMNSHGLASMDSNSSNAGGWARVSYRLLSPSQAAGFWYIY
jgi:surface antigen/LysM repeat protein